MNDDELKAMSGADMSSASLPKLNQILINGSADAVEDEETGKLERPKAYYRKRLILTAEKDKKPDEEDIGDPINVTFLKIRRKLVERGDKGQIVRSTTEHNRYDSVVTLFNDDGTKETGVAKDLREKYEGLRTVQIVYALYKGETVRVMIKGSSLGSKAKDTSKEPSFYDYIKTFEAGEHIFQFETILGTMLEKGQQTYYTMTFKKGKKLSAKDEAAAIEAMKEIHTACVAYDANTKKNVVADDDEDAPKAPANADEEFEKFGEDTADEIDKAMD